MEQRKKISIFSTLLILLLLLAACGGSEPVAEPAAEEPAAEVEEVVEEAAEPEEEMAEEEAMEEEEMASDEPIRIGGIAILEGAFAALGEDSVRGIEMAIAEYGGEVAGRAIELQVESSDGSPDTATNAVRKLVEQDGVDVVVGPLSGDEGIAIKGYAKTQPEVTFVNGVSGAQDATLRDPAPNFYRFNTDGTQWMAGLGAYSFNEKGYAKVATIAEDYSFPYSQVGGFVLEFCQAGGQIDGQFWTPIGTTDYSSIVASIPDDVDAIYVALGGSDAVNFLRQYTEFGGTAPIIGGSITVDQSVLSSDGALLDAVIGTISAGPVADTNPSPEYRAFVDAYLAQFPDANTSPSLFAWGYYVNTLAVLQAIDEVGGDLSDGQASLQAALSNMVVNGPTGPISLDGNRQAIGNNYITEIVQQDDGSLISELVSVTEGVNQTLGVDAQAYLDLGAFDRENPNCGAIAEQFAAGMPAMEEEEMADGSEFGPLNIGGIAILEGAFAALGEDSVRGIEMAIEAFGGEVAGRPIELVVESSDGSPDTATNAVRKLVEQDGVDVVVGPLSGDEGIAIKGYAKTQPEVTFVNGVSGAQDATLRDPAPNFYRFNTDGTQWMAGLGTYSFNEKGYAKVATIAEDYSFPYSQVGGFVLEFCQAGGVVDGQFWTPIGTTDYSSIVASIPADVDAIYVALGGADAVNFLRQYTEFGGTAPIIGGSITVDQSVLSSDGALLDAVIGTISAGPIADTNQDPAYLAFVEDYLAQFPDGFTSPSLFAWGYYVNTFALLSAIEEVGGDLSDGQASLQAALGEMEVNGPTGLITLDGNRQAVGNNYITEVVQQEDGTLVNELVSVAEGVNQTLGVDADEYLALGAFDRENPVCADLNP